MKRRTLAVSIAGALMLWAAPAAAQDAGGRPCVAVMLPSVRGVEGNATDTAMAVRDLLISYLTGPSIQTLLLEARLPSQAVAEAREKQCPHVVTASLALSHDRGGGLGRALLTGAGSAGRYMPGGGMRSAVARSAAIGTADAMQTLATTTRARDEVSLEYSLAVAGDGQPGPPRTEKAKARTDREDIVTPLVERAATDIVARVTRP